MDIGKSRHFVLKNGESESSCSIPILPAILLFYSPHFDTNSWPFMCTVSGLLSISKCF